MGLKKIIFAAAFIVGAVACSSSDEPGASASNPPDGGASTTGPGDGGVAANVDPPTKCRELAGVFCDRAVACAPSDAGTPEEQRTDCSAALESSLQCAVATGIGAAYADCEKELPLVACEKFVTASPDTLPPSCRGVVQSPPPPEPPAATISPPTIAKPNMILGRATSSGPYDVYLGCLCNAVDPDSVISSVGLYGPQSKFSASSIWNRFGTYGSDFSSQSVCNPFANDPPVVVNDGQIIGRLTRNQFTAGAITDPDIVALLAQQVCVK